MMKHFALLLLVASSASAQLETPRIKETGEGTASATPDEGHIVGGAVTVDSSVTKAMADNATIMNKVYADLAKNGITIQDIRTVRFTVEDNFKEVQQPNSTYTSRVKDGYKVTNKLRVTVHDVSKIGPVVDGMVAQGADQIDSIRLGNSKSRELTDAARQNAVDAATRRATLIAEKLGYELGSVILATETVGGRRDPEGYGTAELQSSLRTLQDATPIAGGSQEYRVNIEVTWALKKKVTLTNSREERIKLLNNPRQMPGAGVIVVPPAGDKDDEDFNEGQGIRFRNIAPRKP